MSTREAIEALKADAQDTDPPMDEIGTLLARASIPVMAWTIAAFLEGHAAGSDRVEAERKRIAAWHEAGQPTPVNFHTVADYIRAGLPGWEP